MTPEEIKALAAELRDEIQQQNQQAEQQEYDEWEEQTYRRLSDRYRELQRRIDNLEQEHREKTKTLEAAAKRHDVLATTIDFLDGKITHAVNTHSGFGPLLMPAYDAFTVRDDWKRKVRLISIVPTIKQTKTGRDPEWEINGWQLNTWGDGSGWDAEVIPCHSLAEAHGVIRQRFAADVEHWRKQLAGEIERGKNGWRPDLMDIRAWARYVEVGIELPWPWDLMEHFNEQARKRQDEKLASARDHLNEVLGETPVLPFPGADDA